MASSYEVQFADNDFLIDDSATIIYGDSGIGKSTIARMMPSPCFLMMRGGGEHRPAPLAGSNIPFIEIRTKQQLDLLISSIKRDNGMVVQRPIRSKDMATTLTAVGKAGGATTEPYVVKTLIIDQLSSAHVLLMQNIMTSVARGRENPDTPAQMDFRQVLQQFTKMMVEVNSIPHMHKVYLALADIRLDMDTSEKYGAPMIPGMLSLDVLKYVDFVFRMHVRRVIESNKVREFRAFQTQPDGLWKAKDSTGKLPAYIEIPSPNYDYWNEVIVKAILK